MGEWEKQAGLMAQSEMTRLPPNPLAEPEPPGEQLHASPLEDQAAVLERLNRIYGVPDAAEGPGKPVAGTAGRRADPPAEEWKPVLVLEGGGTGRPARGDASLEREPLVLRVMLQFQRRDGGLGRLKDWSASVRPLEPDPQDRRWVDLVLSQQGSLDLDRFFLLAEAEPDLGWPVMLDRSGTAVRLVWPEGLELRFVPELQPWSGREIRLSGQLYFRFAEAEYRVRSSRNGVRYSYFLADGACLGRLPRNEALVHLLEYLSTRLWQLDPAGVEALRDLNQRQPLPGLVVTCPGTSVEQRRCRGLAVVRLESDLGLWGKGPHRTLACLEVDPELDVPLEPGWQRHLEAGADGEPAILWLRDIAWEERLVSWFRALLAPESETEDEPEEWIPGRFRAVPEPGPAARLRQLDERRTVALPGDTDNFLRTWGLQLMEAGLAIALGRTGSPSAKGRVGINVDRGLDWLDLEVVLEGVRHGSAPGARARAMRKARTPDRERREELLAVQDLLRHRVVRTARRLLFLSPDDACRLERLLDAGVQPGRKTRVPTSRIGQLASLGDDALADVFGNIPEVLDARTLVRRLADLDTLDLLEPAPGFGARLRGYQRRGFSWLWQMNQAGIGACLADDMGLGKTVMALALLHLLVYQHRTRQPVPGAAAAPLVPPAWQAVLVVPVSTLPNWEAETRRFAPGLRCLVHAGAEREKASPQAFAASLAGVELVLVSFATLRQDADLFAGRLWDLVLVDEAQTVKNPESQTFRSLCSLQARHRIALTGTPVENSVQDLWAHMEFLNPGMLGTLKEFRSRYGFAIEERRDDQALATLRRLVRPFMLRRRKEEVALDLPPRDEVVVYCDLGPAQRQVYQDIRDAYRLKVDEAIRKQGVEKSALTILEAVLRLRQACLVPGVINPAWDEAGSAKLELFCDLMSEIRAGGHKVLVFSQFTGVLARLREALGAMGCPHVYLDGQSVNRGELVERFQNDPACGAFLLSLKAGGVGINLTAADYVILFDPWWNPAVEAQAIDRAHRLGQDRPVLVYRLIARDTVEEKIMALQTRKKHLAGTLVGDDGLDLPDLGTDELLALLG